MTLPKALKTFGKKMRSIFLPLGDIPHHLQQLTRKSAIELGFKSITTSQLEKSTIETCYETGIGVNQEDSE